jgi:magnesium transporter
MSEATQPTDLRKEDSYALDAEVIGNVLGALHTGDREALLAQFDELHDADIADIFEQVDHDDRVALVEMLGADISPDVLTELEEGVRDEVLEAMDPGHLAAAVKELDTDDVVYLVEDLEGDAQEKVLEALEPIDRTAVQRSLQYPEETAGRLMQRELVTAPAFWTVGQMIDYMRASDHLPELFYDIIIVDPAMRPVGVAALSRIMGMARTVVLSEIMEDEFRVIQVSESQEDVAYAFNQYHMISAPVVDDNGRLVGMITIDDAMVVLDDEAEEDIKLLAGVGDEEISDDVWETAKARFPWLAVNLMTAIMASLVIAQFDRTMEALIALAVLMPIVASMGGNAGTQTLTVAVRALATRDLTAANAWRVIRRETLVGLANGLFFAVIIGIVGFAWFGDPMLGLVLGMAMIGNLVVAGLAGILIPIWLEKVGADPALASGAFVTTVTDVVGFFAFLGLASIMLL